MADLGEYLGHLLCEVARARVRADMEAVRIAHEYVNDDSQLLRHFPVPRMRLPTLEITLPVQIDRVPEGYAEKTTADTTLLSKVIVQALGPVLKEYKLHITTSEVTRIIKSDPRLSGGELYEGFSDVLSAQLHDHTRAARSRSTAQEPAKDTAGETFKKVAAAIRESLNVAIQALPRKPVGIAVEARTAALREIGNPALLVNLKLSISEDALEIHLEDQSVPTNGKPDPAKPLARPKIKRLLPE